MSNQLKAIFEDGVFRPLQPVHWPEHQRVTVTLDEGAAISADLDVRADFSLTPERWQAFCDALDAPAKDIPALRKLLTEASLFDDNGDATR
jgi:predicted DNA-binding antitoxin AbrB/MazE fold protein